MLIEPYLWQLLSILTSLCSGGLHPLPQQHPMGLQGVDASLTAVQLAAQRHRLASYAVVASIAWFSDTRCCSKVSMAVSELSSLQFNCMGQGGKHNIRQRSAQVSG